MHGGLNRLCWSPWRDKVFVDKHRLSGDYIHILCMKLWLLFTVLFWKMVRYLFRGHVAIGEHTGNLGWLRLTIYTQWQCSASIKEVVLRRKVRVWSIKWFYAGNQGLYPTTVLALSEGSTMTLIEAARWNLSQIAELYQTGSSGPHTTWNDGTWEVHSCLPDLSHKQAIPWLHVSHECME